MARRMDPAERRLWNGLAAARLALQLLEARTELTDRQARLVQTALRATHRATQAAARLAERARGAATDGP